MGEAFGITAPAGAEYMLMVDVAPPQPRVRDPGDVLGSPARWPAGSRPARRRLTISLKSTCSPSASPLPLVPWRPSSSPRIPTSPMGTAETNLNRER
ncbi:MAG: hypothetical protein RXR82_06515 [Nitrososphaeria archaeon]